jgi:hypothetical protein
MRAGKSPVDAETITPGRPKVCSKSGQPKSIQSGPLFGSPQVPA